MREFEQPSGSSRMRKNLIASSKHEVEDLTTQLKIELA
jgi:hypothetical protein